MKKSLLIFSVLLIFGNVKTNAQFSRYIIKLKDKTGSSFSVSNPSQFLSQRAINRRVRYNIQVDQTDLPVLQRYIDSIRLSGNVTVLNSSKWLNQVCIKTNDAAALAKINSFPFVIATTPIAARVSASGYTGKFPDTAISASALSTGSRPQNVFDYYSYGQSYQQIHIHNTEFLHNHGFRGEGMQLAMMDAGFYHYLNLPTFDSIRINNQILGTWDFVDNEPSVNEDHPHGMNCLSTIAANMPGTFMGSAPNTAFYLYRSEDAATEYPVEEQNWAAAAEKADSAGADVISTSLGYNTFSNSSFDYTYSNMNGNTTTIVKAADIAAKKGLAVIASAGNEGSNSWHYIVTPADGDSVFAVGAVNVNSQVAGFSSFGPSSDGRIKPDVAAVGAGAIVANQNTGQPSYNNGTSFSCPIMAGVVTCLWQAFPEVNNMSVLDALRRSANRYNNPDNRTGYGIPDTKKAFVYLIKKLYTQQISISNNCKATINWNVKTASDMNFVIERKLASENSYSIITTQQFTGNFATHAFTYEDNLTGLSLGNNVAYRIKMTIATDTSFYLDSAVINITNQCGGNVIRAENITFFPGNNEHPVSSTLPVRIIKNNLTNVSFVVYAASGQKVYSLANQPVIGERTFNIPMGQLSSGVYFVAIYLDNKKLLTKRIIRE